MQLPSGLALLSSIFFSARWVGLAALATSAACATAPTDLGGGTGVGAGPEVAPPPAPEPLWPAPFRLDFGVRPLRYDLALKIDPREATFSGSVSIPIALDGPRAILRMHAAGLKVGAARARIGPASLELRPEIDADENLALVAERPINGNAILELTFEGPLPETPLGVYRVQDGGRWYAFTQLEPLSARAVFPCFDEPNRKVSFGLRIDVPTPMVAVANQPLAASAEAEPGWTRYTFEDSPPLPTYLLAFAVGELDVVDQGTIGQAKVPFRIIAPKGKGGLAGFAAARAPLFLKVLEDWFGTPYPFAKLDLVAVPSFGASGMENPGLITFRESLLLSDAAHATAEDRAWVEGVLAHELAHMWFGDLVTLAWWDDLWLNEAFASFMGRKVLAQVTPELGVELGALRGRLGVMYADARPEARAVRQPIAASGDVYNAFDGITYGKGSAVLAMVEAWLGPEVFRSGVRAYVAERARGNATTADLMRHLSAAAGGLPVGRVVSSFTDHTGVPVVDVTWSCVPKEAGAPTQTVAVELKQRAYRGPGDDRPATGPTAGTWSVPVCLRFGGATRSDREGRFCGLFEQPREVWSQDLPYCPTWVYPNQGEAGYFRWTVTPAELPESAIGWPERVGILENLKGEVDGGRMPVERWLDQVLRLADRADLPPQVVDQVIGALGWMRRVAPDLETDKGFDKLVRRMLGKQPLPLDLGGVNASLPTKQRTPGLVRVWGHWLKDPRVLAEARRIGEGFLGDLAHKTKRTRLDLAAIYLPMYVARQGADPAPAKVKAREALWKRLRAAFDQARDPSERDLVIEGLAAFEDPALVVKTYELVVDGTLRAQDFRTLRGATSGRPEVVAAVWRWLTERFDGLVEKLGPKAAPALPNLGGGLCSNEDAAVVKIFFDGKRAAIGSGLDHTLAGAVQGIHQCAVARLAHADAVRAWLRAH